MGINWRGFRLLTVPQRYMKPATTALKEHNLLIKRESKIAGSTMFVSQFGVAIPMLCQI